MPREIEARFLEVNASKLGKSLLSLGARDFGDKLLEEIIFYDPELKWLEEKRFVRLRSFDKRVILTYKQHLGKQVDGAEEIEFEVSDLHLARTLIEKLGLVSYRFQQKRRRSFFLDGVTFDFDTWPGVPTYLEIEGESEEAIRSVAQKLGLDWALAVFDDAKMILEGVYKVPIGTLRWFTFDKVG